MIRSLPRVFALTFERLLDRVFDIEHLIERVRPSGSEDRAGHRQKAPPGLPREKPRDMSNTCLIIDRIPVTFADMSDSTQKPGTTVAAAGLTERQRTILEVIRTSVTTRGYPPSIREIGDAVGLTSTSSVAHQLRTLERKGYLRRDPNRPRAVDEIGRAHV